MRLALGYGMSIVGGGLGAVGGVVAVVQLMSGVKPGSGAPLLAAMLGCAGLGVLGLVLGVGMVRREKRGPGGGGEA